MRSLRNFLLLLPTLIRCKKEDRRLLAVLNNSMIKDSVSNYLTIGNNREAPSYMQLPSLQPNSKTYLNTFIEKSLEIENKIKNHESIVKSEELSTENLRKLGRFVHKPGNSLSKSIDKNTSPERVFYEKLNISPKYLKNLNDYNISESFAVNTDRQIQFEKKVSKRFDCLTDQIKEIKPPTLSVDKWSKFYEKQALTFNIAI